MRFRLYLKDKPTARWRRLYNEIAAKQTGLAPEALGDPESGSVIIVRVHGGATTPSAANHLDEAVNLISQANEADAKAGNLETKAETIVADWWKGLSLS